ncbi:MAG: purine-nucleoside phosphorylase [Spirochaetes bacterium]|nr:MAG: purine-nucleoside phosphorylase [Spirochaetota bacterium]
MDYLERVEKSAEFIRTRLGTDVRYAVILGSGFASVLPPPRNEIRIDYSEVPFFPDSVIRGQGSQIRYGGFGSKKVMFFCGRFHLYQGVSPLEVVMPIVVAAKLGVKLMVLTNASGGINRSFKPGNIMLIRDHINFMGENPLVELYSLRNGNSEDFFIDMGNAYPVHLIEKFISSAKRLGYESVVKCGVYVGVKGPNYETPAEIKFFAKAGADAVGMSTVLEVIAAVYQKIEVLGVSIISNMAAGISPHILNHREVLAVVSDAAGKFFAILSEFFRFV